MSSQILSSRQVYKQMGNHCGRGPQIGKNKGDNQVAGALFEANFYRTILRRGSEEEDTEDSFESRETREALTMQREEIAQFMGAQGKLRLAKLFDQTPKVKNHE